MISEMSGSSKNEPGEDSLEVTSGNQKLLNGLMVSKYILG